MFLLRYIRQTMPPHFIHGRSQPSDSSIMTLQTRCLCFAAMPSNVHAAEKTRGLHSRYRKKDNSKRAEEGECQEKHTPTIPYPQRHQHQSRIYTQPITLNKQEAPALSLGVKLCCLQGLAAQLRV
jgi:hypothetical protein